MVNVIIEVSKYLLIILIQHCALHLLEFPVFSISGGLAAEPAMRKAECCDVSDAFAGLCCFVSEV